MAWGISKWNCKCRKKGKWRKEIFRIHFKYQTPSSFIKVLFKTDENKREEIKYLIINELIKLMEDISIKKLNKNNNNKKKILKRESILFKKSLILMNKIKVEDSKCSFLIEKLAIALGLVKPGNTSGNLLNKIFRIIYSLNWEKEITKKVCNKIMSLIKLWSRMDILLTNS